MNANHIPLIQIIGIVIAIAFALALYFLPSIVAIRRNSPHTAAAIIINFFFGATLIGWVVALILATKRPQPAVVLYNVPPPPR